jgi:hypothetical protein
MSACAPQRTLTRQQKVSTLLEKFRGECHELGYGTMDLKVTVHEGEPVQIECLRKSEIWRA